jgi:hypothetical protein
MKTPFSFNLKLGRVWLRGEVEIEDAEPDHHDPGALDLHPQPVDVPQLDDDDDAEVMGFRG